MSKKVPLEYIQKFALEHHIWCLDDSKNYKAIEKRRWVCMKCGNEFWKSWDGLRGDIKRGRAGCPICEGHYRRNIFEMDKFFYKEGYRIRRLYKGNQNPTYNEKLWVECDKGHCTWINWDSFSGTRKRRCSTCRGGVAYTPNKVRALIRTCHYEWVGPDSEYKNAKSKLSIKCPSCHSVFKMKFGNFYDANERCPVCQSSSKLENIIRYFLITALPNEIAWETQYPIHENGHLHLLDFVIMFKDQTVVIEADGEQHRKDKNHWGKRQLTKQKLRDKEKDVAVARNRWVMIRYPDTIPLRSLLDKLKIDLSKWTTFTNTSLDYQRAIIFGRPRVKEVAEYYHTHTKVETAKKFHISLGTVGNDYREYFNKTKWENAHLGKIGLNIKRSGT